MACVAGTRPNVVRPLSMLQLQVLYLGLHVPIPKSAAVVYRRPSLLALATIYCEQTLQAISFLAKCQRALRATRTRASVNK